MRYARLLGLWVLAMLPGVAARGGTLALHPDPMREADAFNLAITYSFGSPGLLSIKSTNAIATITTNGGATHTNYTGTFDIEANINPVTGLASSATMSFQVHYP